jgi:hypothetical protein
MPLVRRRRPLLRAAVTGAAAGYIGKRAGERNVAKQEAQHESSSGEPAQTSTGMSPAVTTQLREVADLHDKGILTDAEFEEQKRVLLSKGL